MYIHAADTIASPINYCCKYWYGCTL